MKNKKIQTPVQSQPAPVSAPTNQQTASANDVAVRAYYIYLSTGSQDGRDEENWHQAEAALKHESRSA